MSAEKKVTFGRIFWPSLLAVFTVSVLGFLVVMLIIGGLLSGLEAEAPEQISKGTVLHLTLDAPLAEQSSSQLDPLSMQLDETSGLSALLHGFEMAANDKNIEGVFIELKDVSCGLSTARQLRNAINTFEKSGKFAVAYLSGEMVSKKEYYISSAANTCYGFPTSAIEFTGLGSELMFFKNTLDRLGVEMQVIRGKNNDFKSAVEPYFLTGMSDSSRLQTSRYLSELWLQMRTDIGSDRKISPQRLDEIAENMLVRRGSEALKTGLIDGLKYRDEVLSLVAKKAGVNSRDLNLKAFEEYAQEKFLTQQENIGSDANVAVVLAEGDIITEGSGLSAAKFCKYLREIRGNEKIKTVVLRINSPGGSALASDEIWREVSLLNQKKKVIVSMGDVAASGGYYIATPASRIFAEPTTITGSIGVFGVIPYTGKMFEDKMGISFDHISTNKHAVLSTNRKLSEEEMTLVQEEVDEIYAEFLKRVAEGRGKTTDEVNRIARGRVWTGTDALRIGLVDELGGVQQAIAYAAKQAHVKNPVIQYYPKVKRNPLKDWLAALDQQDREEVLMKQRQIPAELEMAMARLAQLKHYSGIQMRLPVLIDFR